MLDAYCGAGSSHRLLCGAYACIARGHRAAAYGHARATGGHYFTNGCCSSAFGQPYCPSGRDPGGARNSRRAN